MKAFPAPDLRYKAADSAANPCASAGGSEEAVILSALPQMDTAFTGAWKQITE